MVWLGRLIATLMGTNGILFALGAYDSVPFADLQSGRIITVAISALIGVATIVGLRFVTVKIAWRWWRLPLIGLAVFTVSLARVALGPNPAQSTLAQAIGGFVGGFLLGAVFFLPVAVYIYSRLRSGNLLNLPFRLGEWHPVFPGTPPPAWVALVARSDDSVDVLSSTPLAEGTREWLADWLRRYTSRQPEVSASYVYLAMGGPEPSVAPDGRTTDDGVRGVGSGETFGEPPNASNSTVGRIISGAITELERRPHPAP
jgi:hypothetical protein